MNSIISTATSLIFPPVCPLCQQDMKNQEQGFCSDCLEEMIKIELRKCPLCGAPFFDESLPHLCGDCIRQKPPFQRARSWGLYEGVLAEALRQFKFHKKHGLAWPLAGLLSDLFDREMNGSEFDLVVPVPLHKKRLRERGFDQAALLAKSLAKIKSIRHSIHNLKRIRFTRPQYGLSVHQRDQNVHGAFALKNPGQIRDRRVLLVDDVYTTGSTAKECARVLKRAKAKAVEVIAIARPA
jgi:ComF family protein